jgi:hypothetical protein
MSPKKLGLISALFLSILAGARAQSSKEVWAKLNDAMLREIPPLTKTDEARDGDGRHLPDRRRIVAAQLRSAMDSRSESGSLEAKLDEIAGYFQSDEVRKLTDAMRDALRQEREVKNVAQIAKINDLLKRAGEAVRSAKDPGDLDQILKDFAEAGTQREDRGSESLRAANYKFQSARQQLAHWQDYLAASKSGDAKRASEILRNMASSSNDGASLIPRSEILARAEKVNQSTGNAPSPDRTNEILAKAKTMADVAGVIEELRAYQKHKQQPVSYSSGDPTMAAITALLSMEKTYREFLAGLPTNLEATFFQSDPLGASLIPLRVELLLLVLPRYLGVPADMKPKSGEAVEAFVDRIAADARERGDIPLLGRTREVRRTLLRRGGNLADPSGANAFSAAQNQEAAGQYLLAVASYQSALKSGSDDISPKLIGERLNAIKAAHPEEYEKGMERFLTPPSPRPPYQSRLGQRPFPSSDQGESIDPQPPPARIPNPTLTVPSVAPTASSSKNKRPKNSPKPRSE